MFVRRLAKNETNDVTDTGIENLLPPDVFEDQFYNQKIHRQGANRTIVMS